MGEKEMTCGCGIDHEHDHEHDFEEGIELETIYLVFESEDGEEEEVECGVIGIFEVDQKEYIALVVPVDEEEGDLEEEFYFYEYSENEDGEPILDNILTEEEFDKVTAAFEDLYLEDEVE